MTETNNETPSMNTKVEQMLHELTAQVRELTAQVNAWIIDSGGDGGSTTSCTSTCNTPVTGMQTAPKRRGRPPKTAACTAVATDGDATAVAPKRRGRPPKIKTEEEIQAELNAPPKRRGRPPKVATVEVQDTTTTPAKRRGRPPKVKEVEDNYLSEEDQAWQEVDIDKEESSVPNAPVSMPPAFTSVNPPPMPPPAFPPGAPAFPLA